MPGSGAGTGTFSPKTYQGALSVNDDRADSGLYLMGHRHYAAELGRFISRDPIGFSGGLNLFGSHNSSPLTRVDPTGLDWSDVFANLGDWLTGREIDPLYQQSDPETRDLMANPALEKARKAYWVKNRDNVCQEPLTDYGIGFGPSRHMNEMIWATVNLDSRFHYMGSFTVDMYPCAGNQVQFVAKDTKSTPSFFYHIPFIPEIPGSWTAAPMHNQTQTYTWHEPRPGAGAGNAGIPDYTTENPIVQAVSSYIEQQLSSGYGW